MKPTISILGSGHSGHALAGSFAACGFQVTLVSMTRANQGTVNLNALNTIQIKHQTNINSYKIRYTNQLSTAMQADIIFCTTPATYHQQVIQQILPLVRNGQSLYFSSYFGASRMLAALVTRPELFDVTVVESMSAIHASRSHTYGQVEILAAKDRIPVATYPSYQVNSFIAKVKEALPGLVPAANILETSLNNVGPILHVPLMLFSAARIELSQDSAWSLYKDGLSAAVIRYIKELDKERMALGKMINVEVHSLEEIMLNVFYAEKAQGERDFWHWIRHNDIHASSSIGAPNAINTRYLVEGVYYGLIPLSYISKQNHVACTLIEATIEMTNHMLGGDRPSIPDYSFLSTKILDDTKTIARAA